MSETAADIGRVAALYDRQCASEPIHQLGGVQPHGFLLVVDLGSGLIVQVSEGVTRHWLGIANAHVLLGTAIETWVDPAQLPLMGRLQDLPLHAPALLGLALRDLDSPASDAADATALLPGFECMGHAIGGHAVLEWIATGALTAGEPQGSAEIRRLSAVLSRLRNARNLEDYFVDCVVQLQAMSGYDRVMLYRFLPDWSGEVVAEHTGPGFEPKYRGLRFPATDIPPQARALYERNTLRMLNDTEAAPDLLVPAFLPGGQPLDQSYSVLRSLSPVHQTYLRNMGVRATLVISLMVEGKLWGLLSCHHHQPWVPPHDTRNFMRSSCELIANVVGTRIDDLTRLEHRRHAALHASTLAALGIAVDIAGDLAAAVSSQSDLLCTSFEAVWWGVHVGSVTHVGSVADPMGRTAEATEAATLMAAVERLADGVPAGAVRQLLQLGTASPAGLAGAQDAAGILIARLPPGQDGLCFFLRPELVREVDWAGDPDSVTSVQPQRDRQGTGFQAGQPRRQGGTVSDRHRPLQAHQRQLGP